MVVRYAGTQAITISNENASSTAANRIVTLTGADVVSRGAFVATFFYDRTAARWVLVAFNDGSLCYNAGLVGIGATPPFLLTLRNPTTTTDALGWPYGGNAASRNWGIRPDWTEFGDLAIITSSAQVSGQLNTLRGRFTAAGVFDAPSGLTAGSGATITQFLSGSATWDPPSIAAGDYTTADVTVTGAAVGDKVIGVSHTQNTTGALSLTGNVISANTARVIAMNPSLAGAVNLGSGTLSVLVVKHT